jgi:molybdate transport system substrate-binding protein
MLAKCIIDIPVYYFITHNFKQIIMLYSYLRALIFMLLSCFIYSASTHAQQKDSVMILAASSLSEVLPAAFKQAPAELVQSARFTFAASSTLAQQLGNKGAKADVFISADEAWMDYAVKAKAVDAATQRSFAANRLVLVVPVNAAPFDERALRASATQAGTRGRVQAHVKLALEASQARIAMGDPAHVPAGKYAKVALQALNMWDGVEPHVARADNARAALAMVERGEVALGVVYATDALNSNAVRIVAQVPVELHPPIFYYAAVALNASDASKRALEFLSSEVAKKVLSEFGFRPL